MGHTLRDEHFRRLNAYRQSREYSLYFAGINGTAADETLPSLLGHRWSIDEQIYTEFLEILPPLQWRGGSFLMREYCFGSITTKYSKQGDHYFCEFVDTGRVA